MKPFRSFSVLSAALAFGAVTLVAQTLVLRRFLWRFESAETGVALFLSSWLLWSGLGAAAAATPSGRRLAGVFARAAWLPALACAALYFAHYALIGNLRGWLGVPEYQTFPLAHLALGCLLANAPFCFAAGWGIPTLSLCFEKLGMPVSRAFAWEALGAAAGGAGVIALLVSGTAPDPRDEVEWFRYFPQSAERPGRFETGGGTTFHGLHGGTFYALSSGGVSEVIPEGDRAMERAVLALSQRPYAKSALLLGQVPLATGLALEALRPDLAVTWCPCDAQYGLKLLAAAAAAGVRTGVRAAGAPPHRFLARQEEPLFDLVMVMPPPATSLGGAAWREEAFAREVRRVTQRTGAALFGLACEAAMLTPEKAALLDATVRPVRQAWPESGCFAAGAGGWWIAAQVPGLAYGAEAGPARFALLKRQAAYPTEAVALLYDPARGRQLARQCPVLEPANAVLLPENQRAEEVLAIGLAEALRGEYPDATPGAWLAWAKEHDGPRLLGLLLVILWTLPVAAGRQATAARRLWAAWLAACGALGLAVSLAALYRLQMRFGTLYLLAGAGSCLYLGGLFCGNRLAERAVRLMRERPLRLRCAAMAATGAQAGMAFGVLLASERLATAAGVAGLCLAAGCAAGLAVPFALAASAGRPSEDATVFVLADALGAAAAGLFFVVLVPLAGLWGAVSCFAALALGLGLCVAACGSCARMAAGLALVAALAVLGGQVRDLWPGRVPGGAEETPLPARAPETFENRKQPPSSPQGIPRKLDEPRIRRQMRDGQLSTNTASFWK